MIHCETLSSILLQNNRSGLEPKRPLYIYIPEVLRSCKDPVAPVVYILAPWTHGASETLQWKPFKESLPQMLERLIAHKLISPCVLVAPDFFHPWGGSQFIDSSYFGPQAQCLVKEVFPLIEQICPMIGKGSSYRHVIGRSSGGFGALRLAMDYPGSIAGVAAHSADLGFENLFGNDLLFLCDKLARHQRDIQQFLASIKKSPKLSSQDIHILMLLGCSGFYSPNEAAPLGFDLPVDLFFGEKMREVWQRWLSHDPIERLKTQHANLTKLKHLYVECGVRDQYRLLYGARIFHRELDRHSISHTYQEFDDDHSGTEYRFEDSLKIILS